MFVLFFCFCRFWLTGGRWEGFRGLFTTKRPVLAEIPPKTPTASIIRAVLEVGRLIEGTRDTQLQAHLVGATILNFVLI